MSIRDNFNLRKKPGMTLIEIIISIGILSIVLLMAFSMNTFANNTFNKGIRKSNVQSTLRIASDYVTKQLRFASNIQILDTMPQTLDSSKDYIYVNSTGSLIHYSAGNIKTIANSSDGLSSSLQFQQQDYETVYFKITSIYKGENFSIDSSVTALNIGNNIINGVSTGTAISFTKGQPSLLSTISTPVTSITITAPNDKVLINGGTLQLTANIQPSDASIKTVTWSVDNTSAAKIDASSGLLTATTSTPGIPITVKATANDGSGKTGTYSVTTTSTSILMNSFNISSASDYVSNNGGTLQLMITNILPANATDQAVTWSIDKDSSIAVINSDTGLLTTKTASLSPISVKVTATAKNAATVTASKTITIIPKITIAITGGTSIADKNSSLKLTCTIAPSYYNSSNTTITWSVSGDSKVQITNAGEIQHPSGNPGVITANLLTVTVTVTTLDGSKYTGSTNISVNH